MSARKPIDAPKKSMTEKILLVEDDPMIGEAVVNALADAGKAADWARSGWEATGFLSENKYDAVLLDLGLPGKDGMSVLRELRAKDSETPVVILTARDGLDKLEAMTCVCSVGLDMIAVPGDTTAETISAIIADEAAVGMVNSKTTAVRVIPVEGKNVGDMVEMGGLLGSAPVMPVHGASSAAFIARGGRIPAPLQSLKN